jgi:hypothetical protein
MSKILFDAFTSLFSGGLASATSEIVIFRQFNQPPSAALSKLAAPGFSQKSAPISFTRRKPPSPKRRSGA